MKNLIKVKAVLRTAGIAALVAAIGFSMIACDNGTGGGGGRGPGRQQPVDPLKATYVSYDEEGNKYELVITETVTGRAAYNPKDGDEYKLTITLADNITVKISTGTVASVTGVTIVLQPTGSETTVTVTVSSTGNTNTIISFSADIPVDNSDEPVPRPAGTLTPTNPGGEQPGGEEPGGEQPVGTEGLAYELINNGTAYSVRAGTATSGAVVIPASYNGLPVTEIGERAFYETNITSVTIPASVMSIGGRAFQVCTNLTSITVAADNPNYASEGGILYNKAKTELYMAPLSINGSITIPSSVTSIGNGAFAGCTGISAITIPSSVTSIDAGAFISCTGLTSITIPAGVTYIGDYAFDRCTSLTSVTFAEGFSMTIGNWFRGLPSLTSVTIPNSVTSIGGGAFWGCTGLTSITIPAGVTSIGFAAFGDCTSLTSITIPSSVTSIGELAFEYWESSQTINVQGKANRAATIDAGWSDEWDSGCNAIINYGQ